MSKGALRIGSSSRGRYPTKARKRYRRSGRDIEGSGSRIGGGGGPRVKGDAVWTGALQPVLSKFDRGVMSIREGFTISNLHVLEPTAPEHQIRPRLVCGVAMSLRPYYQQRWLCSRFPAMIKWRIHSSFSIPLLFQHIVRSIQPQSIEPFVSILTFQLNSST